MCSRVQTVLKDLRNLSNIFQPPRGTDLEFTQIFSMSHHRGSRGLKGHDKFKRRVVAWEVLRIVL